MIFFFQIWFLIFLDFRDCIKTQYDGMITPEIPSSYYKMFTSFFRSDKSPYQQKTEALSKMMPNWADSIKRGEDAASLRRQVEEVVSQQIHHCQRYNNYPETTKSDIHQVFCFKRFLNSEIFKIREHYKTCSPCIHEFSRHIQELFNTVSIFTVPHGMNIG